MSRVEPPLQQGSLTVVGTGIRTTGQLTVEAIGWMAAADSLLYVVADPVAEAAIQHLNPAARSLATHYSEGMPRIGTYNAMVEDILACVREGQLTCAAFYGHPGVFAYPSHEAVRRAKGEGFEAQMLPGVSAEDCLFADLNVDPAAGGCQSYEATDLLVTQRIIDSSSQLIVWQIGSVGDWTYRSTSYDLRALPLLVQKLCQIYPPSHEVVVYEAAIFPGCEPKIVRLPLQWLSEAHVTAASTLYVPAARSPVPDFQVSSLMHAMSQTNV